MRTSGELAAEQWLQLDFQKRREYGGLIVDWDPEHYATSYRVQVSGEPNYTVDLQLLGTDGDHNTAGLKATAMRLVNAVSAVVGVRRGETVHGCSCDRNNWRKR